VTDYGKGWEEAYASHSASSLWSDEPVPCLNSAVAELSRQGIRTVLDLGCGDGRNLVHLADAGFAVVGIDLSATALSRAAVRLGGRAVLVRSDIGSLREIPDSSVQAITCFDVFGEIEDLPGMLENFARVLVPGGMLAFNAYTVADDLYHEGTAVAEDTVEYRGIMCRFFTADALRALLSGWHIRSWHQQSWDDPPHGDFRPHEHHHDNWVVMAELPDASATPSALAS
jgi:SAM-dependent methyltransferase